MKRTLRKIKHFFFPPKTGWFFLDESSDGDWEIINVEMPKLDVSKEKLDDSTV